MGPSHFPLTLPPNSPIMGPLKGSSILNGVFLQAACNTYHPNKHYVRADARKLVHRYTRSLNQGNVGLATIEEQRNARHLARYRQSEAHDRIHDTLYPQVKP